MSRLLKVFNHPLTGRFLVTLLLAFGLSSVCCAAFFPAAVGAGLALWCGLFSLIFTGCSALRFRFKGLFFLLLAAVLAVLGIVGKTGPVHSLLEAAKAFVLLNTGWVEILHLYAGVLTPLFCFLLTLTAWGASADESGFSSALFSLAASVILFLVSPAENMLLLALPAFAGFALQLSRQRRFTIAALPFVVLLVIAAFLLTPKAPPTSKPLQEMAESIRTAIEDRLLYTSQRTSFSLKTEGFQPLDTRLGGKPNPSDAEVMRVETREKVLLRGKTYDFYTGVSWEDSLSSKRYLYNSIYNKDLRTDLLAMNRPLFAVPEQMERNVTIHFLKNGTTTLFAPAYTRELRMLGQRMVLYFNTAGELFLTRDTLAGDSYSLSYLPLHAGHEQTARLVASCAGMTDPYYDIIAGQYLTLPGHIQQEVYDIAFDAVEDNAAPYEKALQLQSYLQRNYAYSLDVETPPENVDFTAYFLLGEKKGYCTYFATAMTVLCRINGIPARYVTGYLADPDESGTALVQGKHAHAWTEIYLNGLGWLPIDATGSANTPEESGNNPGNDPFPSGRLRCPLGKRSALHGGMDPGGRTALPLLRHRGRPGRSLGSGPVACILSERSCGPHPAPGARTLRPALRRNEMEAEQ